LTVCATAPDGMSTETGRSSAPAARLMVSFIFIPPVTHQADGNANADM
jgi:hypothetical protein